MITFITVKGTSKRCPNKNNILLPYVLEQVSPYLNIVVITDSLELKTIAEKYNVKVFIEEKNIQISEFNSIYNFLLKSGTISNIDEFVYLPVTQPFRSNELINDVLTCDITDYDFATTYSIVPDRSIFILNEDNTYKCNSYERKGSLCKGIKMIDGCIYKIKTNFLSKIVESDNINHSFWNESKIKFIENKDGLFLDIDTTRDLGIFKSLTKKTKN